MINQAKIKYMRDSSILKNHLSEDDINLLTVLNKVYVYNAENNEILKYTLTSEGVTRCVQPQGSIGDTWTEPELILPF